MSVNIPRTFVFSDGFEFENSWLESEISNVIQTINNANAGLLTWDNVKVKTLSLTTPLTIANGGTNSGTALANNCIMISSGGKIVEHGALTISSPMRTDASGLPTTGQSSLTADVTGILPVANGGTNNNATLSNGRVMGSSGGQIVELSLGQIPGTATNDSATAGNIGEYVSSTTGFATTGSTGAYFDVTSISLTAGDWIVSGNVLWWRNSATIASQDLEVGISTTAGNFSTGLVEPRNYVYLQDGLTTFTFVPMSLPAVRMSLSTTTTVYLKGLITFSSGTPKVEGALQAWRIR